MRTTLQLNDQLLIMAKKMAAQTHRTLTAVIEDALRQVLQRKRIAAPAQPLNLTTFKGKGLQAGVDLDDTDALLDLMGHR